MSGTLGAIIVRARNWPGAQSVFVDALDKTGRVTASYCGSGSAAAGLRTAEKWVREGDWGTGMPVLVRDLVPAARPSVPRVGLCRFAR